MKREQEPKYDAKVKVHIDYLRELVAKMEADGKTVETFTALLFNRATGQMIPDEEPVFIFRAKDKNAVVGLTAYVSMCTDPTHLAVVHERINQFVRFAADHPDRMHEPDSDKSVTLLPPLGGQ